MSIPISKVANHLSSELMLLKKWKQFSDDLGVPTHNSAILGQNFKIGSIEAYEFMNEVLSLWESKHGNQATLSRLCTSLRTCECNSVAETLETTYGLNYIIVLSDTKKDTVGDGEQFVQLLKNPDTDTEPKQFESVQIDSSDPRIFVNRTKRHLLFGSTGIFAIGAVILIIYLLYYKFYKT